MPSQFLKQEMVAFDDLVEGFDDMLIMGKAAEIYNLGSAQQQSNARDKEWIPAPMIGSSYDGFDQTANFGDVIDTSVPVSIGFHKASPKKFTAKELRNEYAINKYFKAAKQKLASDINIAAFDTVALQGGMFSKRTGAATGFADLADLDTRMTRIGIPTDGRMAFYSSAHMNSMAENLANRSENTTRSKNAYEKAMIREDVAGFEVFKNDLNNRFLAAGGGVTTVNGANQRTVPAATVTSATGEEENKDNRYTDLTITAVNYAAIKVGDAFTMAGVNEIHLITKRDTGQLKTHRVVGKPSANVIRVYPAIIDAAEGSIASREYANVTAGPANGAAITWLNTTASELNPFFRKGSLLLLPGTYTVDPEDGWEVMRATTDLGIGITYTRQGNINDLTCKARLDIDFGVALPSPDQAGVQMFSQV